MEFLRSRSAATRRAKIRLILSIAVLAILMVCGTWSARAQNHVQDQAGNADAAQPSAASPQPLPTITVRPVPCAEHQGQDRLACLSRMLTAATQRNAARIESPSDHAAPTGLGLANEAATRQRMGNTYGVSAFPQVRPARVNPPSPFVRAPN